MSYELWHLDGGSIIGAWDTEEEALALVRTSVETHGSTYVEAWALLLNDSVSDVVNLAEGEALVERAHATLAAV